LNGIIFILLATLMWALDTLFRYPLLRQGINPGRIVFTEHLFLVLIFCPFMFKNWRKFWNAKVAHLFYFLVIGAIGSAGATLWFTRAFTLCNPSLVILLQKLQPVVAVVLAHFVLGESLQKKFVIWAAVALVGGVLISVGAIFPDFSTADFKVAPLGGITLALWAVLGWGSSTVFGKKLSLEGYTELEIMAGRFGMGLVALLPFLSSWTFDANPLTWGKILAMVLISGLLGMYFYYQGLKRISARVCALVEMASPFMAVSVNWIFLGATLDTLQIIGGTLLLLGALVIQLRRY
jgi:drug/metabolite transporter (DMT)-like permease